MSKEIASAHEAEKRLLACILINPSCADDVLMLVSTADMSCLPHNILYTTVGITQDFINGECAARVVVDKVTRLINKGFS